MTKLTQTGDGRVARHRSGVLLPGQVVLHEAAAAGEAAVPVRDVTVTAATTLHLLLRQQ